MILPTLRQLSYLLALKSAGSFSAAAEQAFVTQSTLSAGIKELEGIIGCSLVDRSSRQIRLSAAGEDVARHAAKIIEDTQDLMRKARQMSAPMAGPMRLGVIPTVAPYLLPRILTPLREAFPKLDLRLAEDLTERLLEKIRNGTLDAALMAFPYDLPDMEVEILFEEPFVLACAANGPSPKGPLTPDDLEGIDLLLLDDGHCLRDHALMACRLQTSRSRKTFSASSLPTLIQMVAHGYGSTLLPAMAAQGELPENIRLIPFKKPQPSRQIGLAWKKGAPQGEDVKILAKTLKELL